MNDSALEIIVNEQFSIVSKSLSSTPVPFNWDKARELFNTDEDITDLVDIIYRVMCNTYTKTLEELSDLNSSLYHLHQRPVKYLDPDPKREYYINESQLLSKTSRCTLILQSIEPMVAKSLNDSELMYYSLTYAE